MKGNISQKELRKRLLKYCLKNDYFEKRCNIFEKGNLSTHIGKKFLEFSMS